MLPFFRNYFTITSVKKGIEIWSPNPRQKTENPNAPVPNTFFQEKLDTKRKLGYNFTIR